MSIGGLPYMKFGFGSFVFTPKNLGHVSRVNVCVLAQCSAPYGFTPIITDRFDTENEGQHA